MDDDSEFSRRPAQPKLSMAPSWVMLGFLMGAVFVFALLPREQKPAPPVTPPPPVPAVPSPPRLTTIEAVFAEWGAFAVWENDTTEVALWNTDQRGFADFHEVRRVGGTFYFRTLPRLTRRIVSRGQPLPESCPLQFTETEEHYREWVEHGRSERRTQTRQVPRPGPAMVPAVPAIERPALVPGAEPAPARVKVPPEGGRP